MSAAQTLPAPPQIQFPVKMQCLFQPKRYKIFYGGRYGAKTWNFARALLLMGAYQKPLRVLCCRELQNSIDESVMEVLVQQIEKLGLGGFYKVSKTDIVGLNGTRFFFEGLKHNIGKIRSYEGIDVCWVEEAYNVSKQSWSELIPTIRKEGSEIWISFNPMLETDETYVRFVKNRLPENMAFTVEVSYLDNPWRTATIQREIDALKESDLDEYLHVYGGKPKLLLEGAVYAQQLREAVVQSRIRSVPYDPTVPADVSFDLGRNDATAIWFFQKCGFERHYIKYFEDRQQDISYYIRYLQSQNYRLGTIWLPHDAKAKLLGTKLSIYEQLRQVFPTVRIVKKLSLADGINAARTIFGQCWFDEDLCSDGITALRHYRYEIVEKSTGQLSKEPVHDHYSNGADSFRYSAVASGMARTERAEAGEELAASKRTSFHQSRVLGQPGSAGLGWMLRS